MSQAPVICFGQQPCGFLPRRFLFAKFQTARRLQAELGGRIVFFYHDSDHDPRETQTVVKDLSSGARQTLNFAFANKIQKKYSPLYAKRVDRQWQASLARQLPKYLKAEYVPVFEAIQADNVADFCLEMYQALGLLEGIEVLRSSDPQFREQASDIDDFFVDVSYQDEWVRARYDPQHGLRLHRGGSAYIDLPSQQWQRSQVSPSRDTRLGWMQSVIQCTHYVAGAGEMNYLNTADASEIQFIKRDEISDSSEAYLP
ncbi:hypothetical protein QEH52_03205 [Coraliomargarita sp. SDUM461003]|uniref:Uncharacterized protein n=1 Tax=Thalassobacterium maritimum TaxID=3041265 RepID=A0ABU1AQT2_9BACT|nr:hypothetical protein [Coraliomargarita sp. SDUM461003]MDQ8206500.1 hypothetical protein [Coraliomargarita sp. SDUM461003]